MTLNTLPEGNGIIALIPCFSFRFKKGNLRLLQTEDGGWKLEELEEKRRSLDGGNNSSNSSSASPRINNNNNASFDGEEIEEEEEAVLVGRERAASSGAAETPVKSRKDRRKKSSQGSDEGRSESQLLRRYRYRRYLREIIGFFHVSCKFSCAVVGINWFSCTCVVSGT